MTSSISTGTIVDTSVPNVLATVKTYPLAERFCSCPYAAKLLDSERFIKPMFIDTQNIPGATTGVQWNSDYTTPIFAEILIAEEDLQTTKSLHSLAIEIFNAQRNVQETSLDQQASLGNVGMDAYAREKEEIEAVKTQENIELLKQCRKQWSMSPKELAEYTYGATLDPEVYLFFQEIYCHTEKYRQLWVERYQQSYCEKHPAESRSCDTKLTDLCSLDMVMPKSERRELERERICKLFPEAHKKVKNDPGIRSVIQDKCPELLKKSSQQPIQDEL